MGIENDRKLIVNCLPLTEAERAQFIRAAKGMPQEFVGDSTQRGSMNWTAEIPDELKAYATAVIGNITPETCAQCPRLEWLQTWSAGVDKYQRPGVLHPGSMLTNATGAYGQSVSEHMFAMMWSIMKNLHIYAVGNPNAAWQDAGRVISPDGKTALIIGTGDIGSHFARLCKSVGMSTIGIRRNPTVEAPGIDHMVGFESLDDVLQYADVIAMCVPSTPSTHHLLNAERIAKLKTDAIVINAGRGDARHAGARRRARQRHDPRRWPRRDRTGAAAGGIAIMERAEMPDHPACGGRQPLGVHRTAHHRHRIGQRALLRQRTIARQPHASQGLTFIKSGYPLLRSSAEWSESDGLRDEL